MTFSFYAGGHWSNPLIRSHLQLQRIVTDVQKGFNFSYKLHLYFTSQTYFIAMQ